ncbi:MAG: hypothetical protein ACLQVI_26140 [Polyangiaceae bacterium]
MTKKNQTGGAASFAAIVQRHTVSGVARRLEVPEANVRAWASGERSPSAAARGAIAASYAIEPGSWGSAPLGSRARIIAEASPEQLRAMLAGADQNLAAAREVLERHGLGAEYVEASERLFEEEVHG